MTLLDDNRVWTKKAAFDYCRRLTKTHYENFTVGSLLLPAKQRQHVSNLYAYCRTVDDLGDEAKGDRMDLLSQWEDELLRCYSGTPSHPVMVALQDTIERFDIPQEPFIKLIRANRMDQGTGRFETFDDLIHYCDHSANPCGRLFLFVFGYREPEMHRRADYTCTALQLTNFWQDVNRDWAKGRLYIPMEDMRRFGCDEEQIAARRFDAPFRELMRFQVGRAREMFAEGAALLNHLSGACKLDVALFTKGGLAVLNAIERQDYDVLARRPRLSRLQKAWLLLSTWTAAKMGSKTLGLTSR